jgi:hypothetical protein
MFHYPQVDAMGVTGWEGPFRRCCEVTMGVLRAKTSSILTISQVGRGLWPVWCAAFDKYIEPA